MTYPVLTRCDWPMCMMYTAFRKSKLAEVTASTSKVLKILVKAYYKRSLCSIRMTKKY